MGFWKDLWNDDKPCLGITVIKRVYSEPKDNVKLIQQSEQFKQLAEDNKELRKQLNMKKVNAIETDYKLLE